MHLGCSLPPSPPPPPPPPPRTITAALRRSNVVSYAALHRTGWLPQRPRPRWRPSAGCCCCKRNWVPLAALQRRGHVGCRTVTLCNRQRNSNRSPTHSSPPLSLRAVSVSKMVNIPKKRNTFCRSKKCRKHTAHKVTQYKAGKASNFAQGKRRYDEKQRGYGGQTKPVFHKKVRAAAVVICRQCLPSSAANWLRLSTRVEPLRVTGRGSSHFASRRMNKCVFIMKHRAHPPLPLSPPLGKNDEEGSVAIGVHGVQVQVAVVSEAHAPHRAWREEGGDWPPVLSVCTA